MAVGKVFRTHIKPDSSTVSYGKMGVKTKGSLETGRTPDGHSGETRDRISNKVDGCSLTSKGVHASACTHMYSHSCADRHPTYPPAHPLHISFMHAFISTPILYPSCTHHIHTHPAHPLYIPFIHASHTHPSCTHHIYTYHAYIIYTPIIHTSQIHKDRKL